MTAVSWTSVVRLFRRLGRGTVRRRAPAPRRKAALGLDSLEPISLLSAIGLRVGAVVRHHDARAQRASSTTTTGSQAAPLATTGTPAPVTLPEQTLSLGSTLTNFQDLPLSPSLSLFDPSLGTLVSVSVTQSTVLQSSISSQNLDPSASTEITGTLSGNDQINGLARPISQPTQTITSQPLTAAPNGTPGDTVTFPPLQLSQSSTTTYTDAATLAFYTSSAGRTSITPTMTANATGSASAVSSNLSTLAYTTASSTVTVDYTYVPPASSGSGSGSGSGGSTSPSVAPCPTVGRIGRIGIHQQRTLLVVPFHGVVDPAAAAQTSHYDVITGRGRVVPIVSASYDPATNTVTLRPKMRLNVHFRYHLAVVLPCSPGDNMGEVRVPFGTRYSLIGFHDHQGQFVPVRDGHIVRADPPAGHGPHHHHHRPARVR